MNRVNTKAEKLMIGISYLHLALAGSPTAVQFRCPAELSLTLNEAPRCKQRGILAELRRSQPVFTRRKRLRCARSTELRAVHLAIFSRAEALSEVRSSL
jgi:hypothetical protein